MLAVRNLHKSYGKKEILKGISFLASKGQIVSLLGSNGSGKTTTFRCLLGLTDIDKGEIKYNNQKPDPRMMGYMPEERSLFYDVTVYRQLMYMAQLKGLDSYEAEKQAEYWLNRLKVSEYRNQIPLKLSKGNQQKIQLIMCLIGDPEIIILDEPWTGLDRNNVRIFHDVLLEMKKKNKIIILSSHQYQAVQDSCDRFLYLKNGDIAVNVTRQKLLNAQERMLEIEHTGDFYYRNKAVIKTFPGNNRVRFLLRNEEEAWKAAEELRNNRTVISYRIRNINISDLTEAAT
ncbi:MAG: ATP-binding cassette domain-containing protein [Erysipelotrichaceae bacterium]|nr:ATP-binding cassette domain-containing protein [Erysipelotrichaceae bacterium]